MKMLWNVVSFLAVVHLLALLMFLGWLWTSHRLNQDRIAALRALFSPTIAQAESAAAERASEAEVARLAAEEEARRRHPPLPSGEQIAMIYRMTDQDSQSRRSLESQRRLLQQKLTSTQEALEQWQAELDRRSQAQQQAGQTAAEQIAAEQFAKTVKIYETLPGKQAKKMLVALVDAGQVDQAVQYLDAMNARAAAKIIRELKTDSENALATELLERLRTLGLDTEVAQESSNADGTGSHSSLRQPGSVGST